MKNATKIIASFVILFTLSISAQTTLTVTTGTPTLDGVISGGEYTSTPLVTTLGVTLYAMDDGENLYIAATWDDATESVDKKQWAYDGSVWDQSGDEDRIALMFDMGQNDPEGVNCAEMCHIAEEQMYTTYGKVDMWHWKGHRGNPMGFADDKYFDNVIGGDGGRHGDSGTSAYSDNDDDGSGNPTFMATNDPGANVDFLVNDAAAQTAFDPHGTLPSHTVDVAVAFDLGATFTSGDVIPGYVLRIPNGNRADVMSAGKWDSGTWTVEFKRKNSGSEYDFAVPSGGTVDFVHEIFDNVGHDHWMDGWDETVYTLDFVNIVSVDGQSGDQLPETYALSQNYPNPFNPTTTISYAIPQNSYVSLRIFDVLGNEVQTLVDETMSAGTYVVSFDAASVPSGVYFYKLEAGNFVATKKMVLMK